MKLQEMINMYLEYCEYRKELDWNTLKAYRIDLRQFVEFIEEEEPSKEKIERYITYLHKKYKQKTVKRKIASLKVFYAYLEEEEIIEENLMRRVHTKFKEERVLPRIIPREEIEKLLNCMYKELRESEKNQRFILRDVAIIEVGLGGRLDCTNIEVLFATGARVYEIANIRIENINLESGVIRFMGKGGKERIVQIGEESVIELLNRYYAENKEEIHACGYFFINKRKSRFTEQSIRLMLKKYTKQAKLERNITPHMFRHSFATYLIEEGVDISCVQQILGHSSIKTTQIYIHVSSQKQADILREMHPRNKMQIRAA